jgi:dephospho-CoA kinase
MGNVFVIGLAGGIGSGKSTVAGELARLGAQTLDADAMVHELLGAPPVVARVVKRFGRGALDAEGRVDRRALAAVAFRTRKSIRDLERLLHPAVIAATKKRIAALRRAKGRHVVVIDAPLLFEAKMDRMCDEVVFVEASKRARLARLAKTRGWTRATLEAREKHQKGIDYKRRNADIVIRNDASRRETLTQIRRYWDHVQACHGGALARSRAILNA